MAKVVNTCKKHNVPVGHPHVDSNNVERILNEGYRFLMAAPVRSYGALDKGLPLMEQGLAKGGLKRPDDAKLHLGLTQALAGRKDDAKQTLAGVQGSDGAGDLARLWTVYLR